MTKEEFEIWEKFAIAFATTIDTDSNYVVDNCRDVAKYADQMVTEWRKRKGSDSPYRD